MMLIIRVKHMSDYSVRMKLHNNLDNDPEVHILCMSTGNWELFLKLLQTCRNHAEVTNDRVPAIKHVRKLAYLVDDSPTGSIQHNPGLLRLKLSADLVREKLIIVHE